MSDQSDAARSVLRALSAGVPLVGGIDATELQASSPIDVDAEQIATLVGWLTSDDPDIKSVAATVTLSMLSVDSLTSLLEAIADQGIHPVPLDIKFNSGEHEYSICHPSVTVGRGCSCYGRDLPGIDRLLRVLERLTK